MNFIKELKIVFWSVVLKRCVALEPLDLNFINTLHEFSLINYGLNLNRKINYLISRDEA